MTEQENLYSDFNGFEPVGTYGLPYLDDKLISINKGELILIGADSGIGKSTLANLIAKTNQKNGIKTALFSIENQCGDYKRKEIWKIYKQEVRDWTLSFRKFNMMVHARMADDNIYIKAKQKVEEDMEGLYLVEYTKKMFTLEELEAGIKKATKEDGCQLVIFDHIDYLDNEDETPKKENNFLKKTMKSLRGIQHLYNVPIVMFSQLRKNNDSKMIVPSIDEFYGSGDKVKIATTVIVLAPDHKKNEEEFETNLRHTFVCIRKDRFDEKGLARCVFDLRTQSYKDEYIEGYTDKWGYVAKFKGE